MVIEQNLKEGILRFPGSNALKESMEQFQKIFKSEESDTRGFVEQSEQDVLDQPTKTHLEMKL